MASCFRSLLLAAFLLSFAAAPAQKIKVLSYNIHHAEDVHGTLNLEQIARVINEYRPDLVALQEVDSATQRTGGVDQLQQLAALTGMQCFYGKSMDYGGGGYGVGILSRLPIRDSFVTRLPRFGSSEPRVAATVEVELPGGRRVLFTTTHLDHVADPAQRIAQAQKLHEVFSARQLPSILAGDFNAPPTEATMKDIVFDLYRDTDPTGVAPTFPSDTPRVKIDYVLTSKNHRWKTQRITQRYEVIEEKVASDHRPVLAEVRLRR